MPTPCSIWLAAGFGSFFQQKPSSAPKPAAAPKPFATPKPFSALKPSNSPSGAPAVELPITPADAGSVALVAGGGALALLASIFVGRGPKPGSGAAIAATSAKATKAAAAAVAAPQRVGGGTKKVSTSKAPPPSSGGTSLLRDAVKAPGGEEANTAQFIGALGLAAVTAFTFLSLASSPSLKTTSSTGRIPTLDDALELAQKNEVSGRVSWHR